ncbi:putative immunity protein [Arthrobacter sp. A5]|uniref:putative immunity protein n=1 Tax=Arthrobacter sp. A5 TaxID=576926 RepID=UPI003DA93AA6
MANETGDFELTLDELRGVARYAAESAQEVLPLFEDANPEDPRPRDAVEAAWTFANGAARTNLQRLTALDAHRAAKDATTDAARFAGRAAGDAAAAALLAPLAKAPKSVTYCVLPRTPPTLPN